MLIFGGLDSYAQKQPIHRPVKKDKIVGTGKVGKSDNKNLINGHPYIDLGLPSGLKWATCNIGATSSSDYGKLFLPGETKSAMSGGDTASSYWGSGWRTPSIKEFQELFDNCKWNIILDDTHEGFQVSGPNGKTIFLPVAGINNASKISVVRSSYWTLEDQKSNKGNINKNPFLTVFWAQCSELYVENKCTVRAVTDKL